MMRTGQKSGSGIVRWKEGSKPLSKHTNKQWIHEAETMTRGSLVYTVRFFGRCEVDRPKGTETVKEAIRKMKMRYAVKSDGGSKPEKVELIVSVDGVGVHDIKSKAPVYHYPLHRISYCADDKTDKKMFTFIAREGSLDNHCCYVFGSDKCAEEIALTVGQAFDLAYQKFLESYGKESELRKHVLSLQHKINDLEEQNKGLRERVKQLQKEQERDDLQQYLRKKAQPETRQRPMTIGFEGEPSANGHVTSPGGETPGGRRLDSGEETKLRSSSMGSTTTPALISPPPRNPRSGQVHSQPVTSPVTSPSSRQISNEDLLTSLLPASQSDDPFGMGAFQQQQQPSSVNYEFFEMQNAFSRGLDLGSDDFRLEDLDPLYNK